MAILCSHCGAALPKEDSRYCNNCGTLVASHPFSPQSLAARKNSSASPAALPAPAPVEAEKPVEKQKPPIREQIAQQPPARPVQHPIKDELPEWISESEKEKLDASSLSDAPARTVGTEQVEKALSTMHELRVKVWEQKETISMIAVPETPAPSKGPSTIDKELIEKFPTTQLSTPFPEQSIKSPDEEEAIEDRPTRLMAVPPAVNTSALKPSKEPTPRPIDPTLEKTALHQITPLPAVSPEVASPARPVQSMHDGYLDEIERLDTLYLPAQIPAKFTPSAPIQPQPVLPAEQQVWPRSFEPQNNPELPISAPRRRSQRRLPFMMVSVLLFVLVCVGVGTWIYRYQPFSVAPVTQPQQSFKDTALGVSLLYPNGWTSKIDRSKATLYFADSSSTAQVTITITSAGGDLNQYMQQQVTQLALTGAKPGDPVTFAGSSWQQIQGTIQHSGANYTVTLFATMHNGHIVTLLQQAQQTVYPEEETTIFAPLRASLLLS